MPTTPPDLRPSAPDCRRCGGPPAGRGCPGCGGGAVDGLTVQDLLLGLGAALVVVAAIVLTAVRWSRLGATVQALVLLGLAAAAGWAARACRRRRLTATAEAVSILSLAALAVVVDGVRAAARTGSWPAWPGDDPVAGWCVAIWAVSALACALGRWTGTGAPRITASLAAQVPVPLFVLARPVASPAGELLCLAQVTAVAVALRAAPRGAGWARAAGALAAATWCVATPLAAVAAAGGRDDRLAGAGLLAAAAGVAALAAALRPDDETVRTLALGAATVTGVAAAWSGASAFVAGEAWWPVAAAVCAGVVGGSVRAPRRWGRPPAIVAVVLGAIASVPLARVAVDAASAALAAGTPVWGRGPGAPAVGADLGIDAPAAGPVAAHLAVLAAAAMVAVPRVGRRAAGNALTSIACLAVLVAPVIGGLSIAGATGLTLGAAAVAAAGAVMGMRRGRGGARAPLAALAALVGVALLWAVAAPATTVAAVAAAAVLSAGVAGGAAVHRRPDAATAAAACAVAAGVAEAGIVAAALGAAAGPSWLVLGLTATGATLALAGADLAGRDTGPRGRVAAAGEGTAAALYLLGLAGIAASGDTGVATAALAAGTAAAALHALRPGRRAAAGLAVAEAVVLVWLRLAVAGVEVPEAYTAPAAAGLLLLALLARHSGAASRSPSWEVDGPWLVTALAPTALLAARDPGLVRPLGGLAAGALVLVAGAVARRRAPVDVGATVVVALGVRQLAPMVATLPSWATLGACGLALLAVGGTFEQRRRDLRSVRDRYAALG